MYRNFIVYFHNINWAKTQKLKNEVSKSNELKIASDESILISFEQIKNIVFSKLKCILMIKKFFSYSHSNLTFLIYVF